MRWSSKKGAPPRPYFTARRIATLSLLLSLSLILGYVERLFPLDAAIPGIKLGLGNLAVVLALYLLDAPSAALLSLLRVGLGGLLFGNIASLAFSCSGAVLSLICMLALKRTDWFSLAGVSMAGGVCHNVGQLGTAAFFTQVPQFWYYLPVLMLTGLATGLLNGLIGLGIQKRLSRITLS